MDSLTVEFAFTIGGLVTLRCAVEPGIIGIPPRLIVAERYVVECPGGKQNNYKVRGMNGEYRIVEGTFLEHELVPYPRIDDIPELRWAIDKK